ncbi:hypothetical protein B7R77_24005 [Ralstonia solanacearum K60]|uniref:Uncharacterized protein n=1 Tax=Ralstonia solanacearum K60 TaxID=1091042 RepID=A0AAP7ZIU6_RALSL|nr:hypothetical protein B7R77_24005 [Ralstonia solanacearum K60]RIJ84119.1 hypothetical protein RSP822_23050 [Ralstonia solanacearum]
MCCEVLSEALTGALIGQPLSHEMFISFPSADALLFAEGNIVLRAIASAGWARRGLRPWHVSTISMREPGGLSFGRRQESGRAVRIGKVRSHSR